VDDNEVGGSIETYVEGEGLEHIRRAVEDGEIPVIMPFALDEGCKSHLVEGNAIIKALTISMVDAGRSMGQTSKAAADMTPLRLLIINREGGIPSYARSGLPHLSINLESEHDYIRRNFLPEWNHSHPTALSNLELAKDCLAVMPRSSSALVVSHKSPAALIANLITNKPTYSASLPHALLAEGKISPHTPTLIRKGLPVSVIRDHRSIDKDRLTELLEKSFGRKLEKEAFYRRLETYLDFLIVIGDYAGAALCTNEGIQRPAGSKHLPFCYLDKFAVLPSHQGDGTVDFLWVALRDETFGLGLKDAANPNVGSLSGVGRGRDLVWRSRTDNPVNKWYHERSNGFVTRGRWKMFWCDAEDRLRGLRGVGTPVTGRDIRIHFIEPEEHGRLEEWAEVVMGVPSAWSD
jgi:amino-acid N-acetyltransferase